MKAHPLLILLCLGIIIALIIQLMLYSLPKNKKVKLKSYTCIETTYKLNKNEIFIMCGKEVK